MAISLTRKGVRALSDLEELSIDKMDLLWTVHELAEERIPPNVGEITKGVGRPRREVIADLTELKGQGYIQVIQFA